MPSTRPTLPVHAWLLAMLFWVACGSRGGSDAGVGAPALTDGGNVVVLSGDKYRLLGPKCDSCVPSSRTVPDAATVYCGRVSDPPDSGQPAAALDCVAQAEDAGQGWFVTDFQWGYHDTWTRLLYRADGELKMQTGGEHWNYGPPPLCWFASWEETCSSATVAPLTCERALGSTTKFCDPRDSAEDGGIHPVEELDCIDVPGEPAGRFCYRDDTGQTGPPTYRPVTCFFTRNSSLLYCEQR